MAISYLDLGRLNRPYEVDIHAAVRRVVQSGWYILGAENERFEREWSAYCGSAYCVGTGNALDGLTVALRAAGVGPGDEVVVPSNTYIATWLAVSAVGATIVPVDPDPVTSLMTIEAAEAALSPRTLAVLPVALYGLTTDQSWREWADTKHLFCMVDAAQSHGARYPGESVASTSAHATVHSFYPTKNLGALGDGGAIVTDDATLAEKCRRLRNYGSSKKYSFEFRGQNSRLDEVQAAVLLAKLGSLDASNTKRQRVVDGLLARLSDLPVEVTAQPARYPQTVNHVFNLRVSNRPVVQAHLTAAEIGTQIFYPEPPHLSQAYADHGFARGQFPVAERLADQLLAIPAAPYLEESELDQIAAAVVAGVRGAERE